MGQTNNFTGIHKGLTGGAEDYMVKPFEMLELLIRIDKILKRFHPNEPEISIKDVVIDPGKWTVTKNGREIMLKPMEFDCLMMLVHNRKQDWDWLYASRLSRYMAESCPLKVMREKEQRFMCIFDFWISLVEGRWRWYYTIRQKDWH